MRRALLLIGACAVALVGLMANKCEVTSYGSKEPQQNDQKQDDQAK